MITHSQCSFIKAQMKEFCVPVESSFRPSLVSRHMLLPTGGHHSASSPPDRNIFSMTVCCCPLRCSVLSSAPPVQASSVVGLLTFDHSPQVRDLVGADLFERYDSILLKTSLSTMTDVVTCPRAHCQVRTITCPHLSSESPVRRHTAGSPPPPCLSTSVL